MIITTGSPSEAWKILSGIINDENSDIAHAKRCKDCYNLTLREREESVRD